MENKAFLFFFSFNLAAIKHEYLRRISDKGFILSEVVTRRRFFINAAESLSARNE